jgi:putative acetyltransferase
MSVLRDIGIEGEHLHGTEHWLKTPSALEDAMDIRVDAITDEQVIGLIREHLQSMAELSPPESVHALGLEALRQPDMTFWSVWDGRDLLGCGALKELNRHHGEVKSMRTSAAHLRRGVAKHVLHHIVGVARERGYGRLSLETGSQAAFEPARRLYSSFGFRFCGPFGDYVEDPNSVFMTIDLQPGPVARMDDVAPGKR